METVGVNPDAWVFAVKPKVIIEDSVVGCAETAKGLDVAVLPAGRIRRSDLVIVGVKLDDDVWGREAQLPALAQEAVADHALDDPPLVAYRLHHGIQGGDMPIAQVLVSRVHRQAACLGKHSSNVRLTAARRADDYYRGRWL
jgi:hypothetical protein